MLGGVDLPKSQLVMIFIIKHVHEISIERMNVLHAWEVSDDLCELVMVVLLCELDLSKVESSNATDVVLFVDDGGRLSLGFGEDDIDEVLGGGNHLDLLEVILRRRHGGCVGVFARFLNISDYM